MFFLTALISGHIDQAHRILQKFGLFIAALDVIGFVGY